MWIARDKDGVLDLYKVKPVRTYATWCSNDLSLPLDKSLYPHLKWEDEPIEVELWSKDFWARTIDDIIHMYITKNESGNYASVLDIVNDITKSYVVSEK